VSYAERKLKTVTSTAEFTANNRSKAALSKPSPPKYEEIPRVCVWPENAAGALLVIIDIAGKFFEIL
jgi:hypothetical protein